MHRHYRKATFSSHTDALSILETLHQWDGPSREAVSAPSSARSSKGQRVIIGDKLQRDRMTSKIPSRSEQLHAVCHGQTQVVDHDRERCDWIKLEGECVGVHLPATVM